MKARVDGHKAAAEYLNIGKVKYKIMGAAASSPFVATSRFFRQVADDPSAAAVETIDVCLACEKDSYSPELRDMSEKKKHFR